MTNPFTVESFARTFLQYTDQPMALRIALGMKAAAPYLPVTFSPNCMLPTVGCIAADSAVGHSFGGGILFDETACSAILAKYPQHTGELQELWGCMRTHITQQRVMDSISAADHRLMDAMACWGGTWGGHANISYGKLCRMGTNGIRAEIRACLERNPDAEQFYLACAVAMDALDALGDHIAAIAVDNAKEEPDESRAEEWRHIANAFAVVPRQPASDFYQAIQVYWMLYTLDGVDSPGRFDQEMLPWYEKCPEAQRKALLRRFLEGMHDVRGWNLCISGSDENWNDETNILSYDILELVTQMGYQTPNLTLRVHPNTPQMLWDMAAVSLSTGTGLPAIYNDVVVCAALEQLGIPPEDSHDYCMNGCNQIDIMGKSHMGLEDGEVNFGKVLEFTLHGGYDMRSGGKQLLSLPTVSPVSCVDFDAFMTLFYIQLDHITDAAIRMSNTAQAVHANYAPNPLRSCLLEGCLAKGRDYKNGGPLYGHGQVLAEGIADAADALYAIKKLVYEDNKYTMTQLITALRDDFAGHEQLHHAFSHCAKFGNDIPVVDAIAADIMAHFCAYLKTKQTFRGGIFTGGCSPFNRAAANGAGVAALPNGKKSGDAHYADSIAATPGNDMRGPTASIKSMLRYDQTQCCSGFVAQMKFEKNLFATPKGIVSFVNLAQSYFAAGGQQLSVNVLDRETLLAAQKDPQSYRSLVVRVGGYSDYFCNLSPELQQNVIDRASFTV